MDKFNFGENLWRIRKSTGISQESMALQLGITQTMYSKIERGLVPPPDEEFIRKAAAYMNVPVATLKEPEQEQAEKPKLVCSLTSGGRKAYAFLLAMAVFDCTLAHCKEMQLELPLHITAVATFYIMVAVITWNLTVEPIKTNQPAEPRKKIRYWFIDDVVAWLTGCKDQVVAYLICGRRYFLLLFKKVSNS